MATNSKALVYARLESALAAFPGSARLLLGQFFMKMEKLNNHPAVI